MKFLNHLDLVENEARRLKMYRIAATSYTPGITTSGNIIMDTGNNIPKWWDGSAWRDFSYNTSGGVNTQNAYATSAISSSGIKLRLSGSGAAGNTTDDVQFLGAGGATVSLGNASQIVITTTDTDTNTTYGLNVASGTTKIRLTGSDSTTNDVDIVAGTGFMSVVRTNANKLTLNNETYNIGISTPTTAVSGKNVAIDLGRSSGTLVDEVGIQDGTYITNSIVNAGTFKGDLSASDGTAGEAERVLAKSNKWITIASINPNTNTQNAYAVSAADGSNTSREKIVLSGSGAAGSTTDFVEIGAGTGLTIARAGDVITLTNSNPTNTNTTYSAGANITLSGTTFSTHAATSVNTTDGTYINLTPNSATTGAVTVTADLSAVDGSNSGEDPRVLSKNNKWVTVASINSGVNTDIDVNNANLLTKLAALESAGGAANQNIVIGTDSGDTIVITGNLQVAGTTTTIDSTTVEIADNIIHLNANATGAPSVNAGFAVNRGTGTANGLPDVSLNWNESQDTWYVIESSGQTNQGAGASTLVSKKVIQDGYTKFAADGGTTTTAANPIDILTIAGGTNCTTAVTTDTITVNVDTDTIRSGVHAFKNVAPKNTNNAGTVSSATNGVIAAEQLDDTLSIQGLDSSIAVHSVIGTDTLTLQNAVRATSAIIAKNSLTSVKKANITHGFGNDKIIVQCWDAVTHEVLHTNMVKYQGNNNVIQLEFSATPTNNVMVNIMEVNLNTPSTVAYPNE